jgi:hypothetical protein
MDSHCPLHLGWDVGGFAEGRVAEAAANPTAQPRPHASELPHRN